LKLHRNKKSLWKVLPFNPELKFGNYNKFHQTIPSPQSQSQGLKKSVVGSREKDQETSIPMDHEQKQGLKPSFPKIDNYNCIFTESTRDRSHSSSSSSIQITSQPPLHPNFQPAEREHYFYQAKGGHSQFNHHGFESSTFNYGPDLITDDYQLSGPQYAMPDPGQYPFQHQTTAYGQSLVFSHQLPMQASQGNETLAQLAQDYGFESQNPAQSHPSYYQNAQGHPIQEFYSPYHYRQWCYADQYTEVYYELDGAYYREQQPHSYDLNAYKAQVSCTPIQGTTFGSNESFRAGFIWDGAQWTVKSNM
jgi:hypothetical protein